MRRTLFALLLGVAAVAVAATSVALANGDDDGDRSFRAHLNGYNEVVEVRGEYGLSLDSGAWNIPRETPKQPDPPRVHADLLGHGGRHRHAGAPPLCPEARRRRRHCLLLRRTQASLPDARRHGYRRVLPVRCPWARGPGNRGRLV